VPDAFQRAGDAGMREVFRGDLSSVELAAGLLEEQGIEFQRRWEQAGGVAFSIGDTALLPGRAAVLLVPSVAYDEARNALAAFEEPEPDQLTELSSEVDANRRKRRSFASGMLLFMAAPFILAVLAALIALLRGLFQ
jgi:hypothetical protein